MAKRRSKSPLKTRDDAKVDKETLKGSPVVYEPVSCGVAKDGRPRYRLKIANEADNIIELRDVPKDELYGSGIDYTPQVFENVINALCSVLPKYIAKSGHAVRLGNLVTLKPSIKGTIQYPNETPDSDKVKVEIHATVTPSMRHALELAELKLSEDFKGKIISVVDLATSANKDAITDGDEIRVVGSYIYVVPNDCRDTVINGGSAYLADSNGKKVGEFKVITANDTMLTMKLGMLETVSTAKCKIVLETPGTEQAAHDKSSPLLIYSKAIGYTSR